MNYKRTDFCTDRNGFDYREESLSREYWRYEFAGRIAAAAYTNPMFDDTPEKLIAVVAVEQADALLAALEGDDD